MKMSPCCWKALAHGESICPGCQNDIHQTLTNITQEVIKIQQKQR